MYIRLYIIYMIYMYSVHCTHIYTVTHNSTCSIVSKIKRYYILLHITLNKTRWICVFEYYIHKHITFK